MNTRTLAAAVLALGLAACAQESNGVGLYAICAPPAPDTTTGACVYPTSCDTVLVSNPKLDTSTARLDFRLPLQISNQLTSNLELATSTVSQEDG